VFIRTILSKKTTLHLATEHHTGERPYLHCRFQYPIDWSLEPKTKEQYLEQAEDPCMLQSYFEKKELHQALKLSSEILQMNPKPQKTRL